MKWGEVCAAALLAAACSSTNKIEIGSDHDPRAEFDGLRTYGWMKRKPDKTGDPRIDGNEQLRMRVRGAVEDTLSARGYKQLVSGEPDFWIAWHAAIDEKVKISTMQDHYGYTVGSDWDRAYRTNWAWIGPGGPSGRSETVVDEWEQGSLILEVVDPKTNKLMWRGVARARLSDGTSEEQKHARIKRAVARMLDRFPPG